MQHAAVVAIQELCMHRSCHQHPQLQLLLLRQPQLQLQLQPITDARQYCQNIDHPSRTCVYQR